MNLINEDYSDFIDKYLQVGQKLRINYGKGNRHNKLIHIRAVIDSKYVVYCYWRNFRYNYIMDNISHLMLVKEDGHLERIFKRKGKLK